MQSTDQSNKSEGPSSPPLGSRFHTAQPGSISTSLENEDDEVARAIATAVSVSKMSPAHRAEVRTLQDEQQRALLEKHHPVALAKAQWEDQMHHPELMVKDAFQKITKRTPQELEAVWKCKTKEMQNKLKELSISLKLPGGQQTSASLLKPTYTASTSTDLDVSASTTAGGTTTKHGNTVHFRRQSWMNSLNNLEKQKLPMLPFEINAVANDTENKNDEQNLLAIVGSTSALTCNSDVSIGYQETSVSTGNEKDTPTPSECHQTVPASISTQALCAAVPTLTSTVWKRRDGLAKFSGKTSWERRKLVLQDNKLFYFAVECLDRAQSPPRSRSNSVDITYAPVGATEKNALAPFSIPVGSWLEQAAAALSIDLPAGFNNNNFITSHSGEGISPRGFVDLVKENVTVAVSPPISVTVLSGQINAAPPTPFCLSIKIEEKTKWKISFETHQQQVQWLVALSNVVVQHSIEEHISEQVAKSADAKTTFTVEDSFFVLKDGNEVVFSNESISKSVVSTKETHDKETSTDGRHDQLTAGATTSGQVNVSCRNGILSIPLSTIWNIKQSIIKTMMSSASDETDQPLTHPPVVLYLIGERLEMALCTANTAVIYTYCYSDSIQVWKFILLIWLLNTILAYCCSIVAKNDVSLKKEKSSQENSVNPEDVKSTQSNIAISCPQPIDDVMETKTFGCDAMAGASSFKISSPDKRKDGVICWMEVVPSDIKVRSVGYLTTKKKIPSPGSLYECVAFDVLDCDRRIPDIGVKVKLDKVLSLGKAFDQNRTWISPDVFVISVALPTEAPKLGWATDDGVGITLVAYMKMRDDTREILQYITAPDYNGSANSNLNVEKVNGVRLFEEWCKRSPSDPAFQGRFKFIPTAVNTEEVGMPSYIAGYNGKPVLIKRAGVTGTLHSHPDAISGGLMEYDINLHAFPYLAKQAFTYMRDNLYSKIVGNMAFTIEGRHNDELPEVLIGGFTVYYPDPDCLIRSSDFFSSSQ